MNFSEYMLDCALHGNQGIAPYMAVKMQEMVNMMLEITDSLDERDYISKEELRQKAHDFEGLCTPLTPQEKYNRLDNNVGLFIEGVYEIWESLAYSICITLTIMYVMDIWIMIRNTA